MKCPYCSNEMKRGYIRSNRTLEWTPDNESPTGMRNEVQLADFDIFRGSKAEAFYCAKCKKVIINT